MRTKFSFLIFTIIFLLVFLSYATGDVFAEEMDIRKGGSLWARIEKDGYIRISGSLVGRFESDGYVRKSGSLVGEIEEDGTIRESGSFVGRLEKDGTMRKNGSIIGRIESDGYIRLGGSIWGSVEGGGLDFDSMRAVAAVLVFFAPDYWERVNPFPLPPV
jgi:hypothetical protein